MDKIILTNEEIDNLKLLKEEEDKIVFELGLIEYQFNELKIQKDEVLNKIQNLKQKQKECGHLLNQKYGEGIINLESGELTKK